MEGEVVGAEAAPQRVVARGVAEARAGAGQRRGLARPALAMTVSSASPPAPPARAARGGSGSGCGCGGAAIEMGEMAAAVSEIRMGRRGGGERS